MPNIKISELTAPIAVTDSDILPVVQSSVTRKITWGALKSTLAGALGRAYLGLGTASTANVTTSVTDTTAGRLTKVGDFGLGSIAAPVIANIDAFSTPSGFYKFTDSAGTKPVGGGAYAYVLINNWNGVTLAQTWIPYGASQMFVRTATTNNTWGAWVEVWTSGTTNAITVDTASLGYGPGSGGTVTQATSKATGVTLNKPSGQITTASNAIAANSVVSFTLTNNKIGANDIPEVVIKSGATAGAYVVQVDAVAAGSCRISIRNMTAGSLSETLVLQFNNEKGAVA